jgi:hypothetical protein
MSEAPLAVGIIVVIGTALPAVGLCTLNQVDP